ncbi:MAG: hypothetical protein V4703_14005 [Actinomycetota bacterium]
MIGDGFTESGIVRWFATSVVFERMSPVPGEPHPAQGLGVYEWRPPDSS